MKNNIYWSILLMCSVMMGCTDDKNFSTLNESEIFFSETLASISKDDIDEHIYYIGTEDGVVYIYNSENQQMDKINTDFDRIYKVVKDTTSGDEPVYWVGTRNMGLFRCGLKNGSFVMKKKHGRYYIPAARKGTKYSAYDISVQDSGVYVATSHGLLKVPKETDENDTTLIILSPASYREKPDSLRPVVVCSFQPYNDQYLFCASDSGLLRVTLSSDMVERFLHEKKIKNIVVRQNEIFSMTGDSVLVTDSDGNILTNKSFGLNQPAHIYYYDETNHINYFISNQSIQLVKDVNLDKKDQYKQVQTRRSIRPKCRNVIVNDPHHSQSLLVTNHSISRIGHHQDVFNSYGNVKLACTDKDNIYYLIDTKLYCQKKGKLTAHPLKDITGGTKDIRLMEVLNNELYYVDSDNEIYKASLYSNYFLNSIFSWDSHIKQAPSKKKEVTAIGKDGNNVYVGVRDGFRNLNDIDKDIPLKDLSANIIIPDPFITMFITNGDSTLLCTLNDGISIGKDNIFKRFPDSNSYTFIRDMGIDTDENKMYLLTNRGFYHQEDATFIKDRDLSGYNRVLVLDSTHVYGVSNFGVTNLRDSMNVNYFVDIQFNPMACISAGDTIYAGSSNGVYVFTSTLSKENRVEAGFSVVDFDEQDYFSRTNILLFTLIMVVIVLGLWWYDRYRMSRGALMTYQESLLSRLAKLKTVYPHLDEGTCSQIETLEEKVKEVDTTRKKDALKEMRVLSRAIMEQTESIPFFLAQKLRTQMEDIEKTNFEEASSYVDKTQGAIKAHTLLLLGEQIIQNNQFLEESTPIMEKFDDYKTCFKGIAIPVVKDKIKEIFDNTPHPDMAVNRIEQYLENLDAESIKSYLTVQIEKAENLRSNFSSLERETSLYIMLNELLQEYKNYVRITDMTKVIKSVPLTDCRFAIIEILRSLPQKVAICIDKHDEREDLERKLAKNSNDYALLGEDEKEMAKKADTEKRKKMKSEYNAIAESIKNGIEEFYIKLRLCPDQKLMELFDMEQKKGQGSRFRWENVLALLMSGVVYSETRYSTVLQYDSSRIRESKSQIQKCIENRLHEIAEYAEANRSSIAVALKAIPPMLQKRKKE